MKDLIKDAFRYYAPGAIEMEKILAFLKWQRKPASTKEIGKVLDELRREGFVCLVGSHWQISSANRQFLNKQTNL